MTYTALLHKTAVIIGGTSGIGCAIAKAFVQEGACVIPVSRRMAKVKSTLRSLKALGNTWDIPYAVDVCSARDVKALVKKIAIQIPTIDVVVCTAGTHLKKDFFDMTSTEWHKVLDVNLTGTYIVNKHFGACMVAQGKGSIVNITSLGAHVALSKATAYCVSKAGVAMLTKSLAYEWADKGVRVNAILPGVFPTELNKRALSDRMRRKNIIAKTPMKRLGSLKEITGAAVYLASDAAGFVTGTEITVDGGFLASSGF